MFEIVIEAQVAKRVLTSFDTEAEAISFCEEYGWCWEDENGFVWDMDYREV